MADGLALALSGGGARGAFQVGVLDELIRVRGVDFETAAGTSTGAIQAAAVVQNDVGRLVEFWTDITDNCSIYRDQGGLVVPIVAGLDSLYDPTPLRYLLSEMFDDRKIRSTSKALRIAVVNIATGELRIVTEKAGDIADWVYASSAQPPFFPPHDSVDDQGREEKWVDGGVRDVTPFDAALKERPRAVLVVRAEAPLHPPPVKYDNLIKIGLQSVELLTREVGNNDVKNVELMNRLLEAESDQRRQLEQQGLDSDAIERIMRPVTAEIKRFDMAPAMVIQPPCELYDRLEFDPSLIKENIDRGREAVSSDWSRIAQFLGVPE